MVNVSSLGRSFGSVRCGGLFGHDALWCFLWCFFGLGGFGLAARGLPAWGLPRCGFLGGTLPCFVSGVGGRYAAVFLVGSLPCFFPAWGSLRCGYLGGTLLRVLELPGGSGGILA